MCDCSHGPVSSMPGSLHPVPEGTKCDQHPDRPATKRIQGETDSFGCEFIDMCDECHTQHIKHVDDSRVGQCEWCNSHVTDLRPTRDLDEGMAGPVYEVCGACRRKQNERATEELESLQREYPTIDDDWDPDDDLDY